MSSMRLLVVSASPPLTSFSRSPKARIAPQPPGPGLPEQAPSVWMTTCGSLKVGGLLCVVAFSDGKPASTPDQVRGRLFPENNAAISLVDPVVAHAADRLMETQLAEIFQRVLPPHQRGAALVEPVDQPREQEP